MTLEEQLREYIYEYFDEHPNDVPDLEEFVSWLYGKVFEK